MAAMTLFDLPSEVIDQIILFIPPAYLPTVELVSKQFNIFAKQPVIWRQHCQTQFSAWNAGRKIDQRLAGNVRDTDWKAFFTERHGIDRAITREINSILNSQSSRIKKSTIIVQFGYEAKDTLLRHCNVGDEVDDVLARR